MKGYTISSNLEDMDMAVIHTFISHTYWAKGIPKVTLQKAMVNSICFGVFDACQRQVGFARVVSDKATFAYLADVFILPLHRGNGLSKWLMQSIINHSDLQGLRRTMLVTKDAHSLYAQFGFTQVENPQGLMQIWQPDVYQS
tara:strand:+ start:336 stop:761 length:426 start_codon:yes stop_codon:yes gene_type:complete